MEDPRDAPRGEGPRYQPEFSAGERLARLEALYESYKRSEAEWQEQLNRRFGQVEKDIEVQHEERIQELSALRRELNANLIATDKAISLAGNAQEKQNTLTREDALRARESVDERVRALERGESQGVGAHARSSQISASVVAWASVAVAVIAVVIAIAIKVH